MKFPSLPIASLPLPPAPEKRWGAAAPDPTSALKHLPLEHRLTLNPTISAKANYYDLAQTRRPPFDLRTSLLWLCLCAHDNRVWWEPRSPDHTDGEDAPPLPYKLDFTAWGAYIDDWAAATFKHDEERGIESLALKVWLSSHETACVPVEGSKKNTTPAPHTGLNSTPTSSPEAMPPGETTSSSPCPSEPSMPSSTHGSPPPESPSSAPQNPPAATPRSTPSSPPPANEPFWVAECAEGDGVWYGTHVDQGGFIHATDNIHAALKFCSEAESARWILGKHNSESYIPREHIESSAGAAAASAPSSAVTGSCDDRHPDNGFVCQECELWTAETFRYLTPKYGNICKGCGNCA